MRHVADSSCSLKFLLLCIVLYERCRIHLQGHTATSVKPPEDIVTFFVQLHVSVSSHISVLSNIYQQSKGKTKVISVP
jgi:hypothetical protein